MKSAGQGIRSSFVGSFFRCRGSALGCFPSFLVRGMTCRDDEGDGALKIIDNCDANVVVVYVERRRNDKVPICYEP